MTYISLFPSRRDTNAIFVPSGDHDGFGPESEELVNSVWSEPSAFITLKPLPLRNAIFAPSDDQAGY
jgi:hypothetical protein